MANKHILSHERNANKNYTAIPSGNRANFYSHVYYRTSREVIQDTVIHT
jgi:hypothetical protein